MQGHSSWIIILKSSDKTWSTGEGNGNPLQYSCLKNLMDNMKRQKYMTLENEPPSLETNMPWGNIGARLLIATGRMKSLDQIRNETQLWVLLVENINSNAVRNSIE